MKPRTSSKGIKTDEKLVEVGDYYETLLMYKGTEDTGRRY